MNSDPFKEYIRQSEPGKRDKSYAWHTAIGLQAVDGLNPSKYLVDTAIKNIEGQITIDEAQQLLNSYYKENPSRDPEDRTEEADKVSVRIAKILSENAWYFRNALVRANYNDLKKGVHETTEYLEIFLRNLLLDEKNELHNRAMHISGLLGQTSKADIEDTKADIEDTKADIQKKLHNVDGEVLNKTVANVLSVYKKCGKEEIFGRSIVENITGLKSSRASELLKLMLDTGIIRPVEGHGKGKYRFKI